MKAWLVSDEEGKAAVVFHNHGQAARRIGAEEIETDFEYVECSRAPEYDKYNGSVPVENLIKDHGWWWECHHCSRQVHNDNEDPPIEDAIFIGERVFCDQSCRDFHLARIKKINDEAERFEVAILTLFPNLEITGFAGGYPSLSPAAYFTFPGMKHGGGTIRPIKKELMFFIPNGDLGAWKEFGGFGC